jgi:hypothetical protein
MNHLPQSVSHRLAGGAKHWPYPRRWPRVQVQLPVVITAKSEEVTISVPGLVGELSRCGMALYAGIRCEPGELMHVEFRTSARLRVSAVVRNCSGYCLGLEFLAVQAGGRDENASNDDTVRAFLQSHERYLRSRQAQTALARKRILKIRQLRQEIEILLRAADMNPAIF